MDEYNKFLSGNEEDLFKIHEYNKHIYIYILKCKNKTFEFKTFKDLLKIIY